MDEKDKKELEEYRKLGTPEELKQIRDYAQLLVDKLTESGLLESIQNFKSKQKGGKSCGYSTQDQ